MIGHVKDLSNFRYEPGAILKSFDHKLRITKWRAFFGAVLVLAFPVVAVITTSGLSVASSVPPTCTFNQLEVAVGNNSGDYSAAGNEGIPFIVVNVSKTACGLRGYPNLHFVPNAYKGSSVKVIHRYGMIFKEVKPVFVIIKPDATASFGLNYGDAVNQQDPSGAPCSVRQVDVVLPVRGIPSNQSFETTANFNFCFTGFVVAVTSIQAGPTPQPG